MQTTYQSCKGLFVPAGMVCISHGQIGLAYVGT